MKCIICKGTGEIEEPKHKSIDGEMNAYKKAVAKELASKGYSYRQIQKALGYKSVRSVHLLIKGK